MTGRVAVGVMPLASLQATVVIGFVNGWAH
jgi:hypothetical protein